MFHDVYYMQFLKCRKFNLNFRWISHFKKLHFCMANRKVNAAEQQIIVDNLNYLWSLNPCQAQANALANIYRAVFPKRSWEGNAWSLWVDLGAFAASAPPEDVEDIDTEEAEDAPADDDVSPAPSNGRRTRKRGK